MSIENFGESMVTVHKSELLSKIEQNRSKHRDAFLAAQKGYREQAIKILDATLAEAREGTPFRIRRIVELIEPQEHTADYDRVIAMLRMSVAEQVTISERQFAQYVLDDWGWKEKFIATNSRYSG